MCIARSNLFSPIALLLLVIPPIASAQSSPTTASPPVYYGAREVVDGAHIPPIPNASFSARVELQTTQTLADGTTVTRRTFNIIARDFRGRTHNEMRDWISSADGSDAKLTYSIIYDPETRTRTLLYPAMRLARQIVFRPPAVPVSHPNPPISNPLAPTIQKQDLGTNFRDGLQLTGFLETRTYPPGSIGNDRPFAITNEYWYSPDLHVNILVKRTDPRFGTQNLQLTDLRREEPDASLFEVPADYKLVNENGNASSAGVPDGNSQPTYDSSGRIRLGGKVMAVKILNLVQPVYPPLARQTRISGTVRLHAIIGKDGAIEELEVISGHPLLQQAALDAVRQWRYQPTLLNGEPMQVDTTIDVLFALNSPATSHP